MSAPDHLLERYGAPRRGRRAALVAVCVTVGAVFLGWLAWTTLVHARPAIESQLVSFEVDGQHQVEAVVQLSIDDDLAAGLRDETARASCTLRAFAEDHTTVGELTWTPQPASGQVAQTIRTERQATSVEAVGCTADGQSRPR